MQPRIVLLILLAAAAGAGLFLLSWVARPSAGIQPDAAAPSLPLSAEGDSTTAARKARQAQQSLNLTEASQRKQGWAEGGTSGEYNLEVQVIDARTFLPLSNAEITVFREGRSEVVLQDDTEDDGIVRLKLPEGEYRLLVDHNDYAFHQISKVRVSSSLKSLRAALSAGVEVSGRLVGTEGVRFAGAKLIFSGPSELAVECDAGGGFRARLIPGIYRLSLEYRDSEPVELQDVAISEQAEANLDLEIQIEF